jgi:HSP20 family protein
MNRMLEQFFNTPFVQPVERGNGHGATIVPVLDVKEDQDTLVVTAELPGVDRENVQIRVQDNILELRGHKSEETKKDEDNFHMIERSYGSFARRLVLPTEVDSDQAEASMERGVLTLRLPKAEPKPGMKSIEIKEGRAQG